MKAVKLLEYSVNIDEVNFGVLVTKFTELVYSTKLPQFMV